jgi:hypothetical protein
MTEAVNKALSAAVLRLLRPLVRVLLRHGVSFGAFSELAKWVYVDIAESEFGLKGRKQSVSRVSVLTGLTRKEVARVQKIETPDDAAAEEKYNRVARVISGWTRDNQFLAPDGEPRTLEMEGEGSFSELVRLYSGDMPARAVLDEMLRIKAVTRNEDGQVTLVTRAYVPAGSDADKLYILGTDVAFLLETIDHNLQHGEDKAYFQRKVSYDNLPAECIPRLRRMGRERAQSMLEELNEYLLQQDRDANPKSKGTGRKRAGFAVYYFEEDVPEDN